MSFYMATPSEGLSWIRGHAQATKMWAEGDIEVWLWSTRLFMFKGNIRIAELIAGVEGLKKYYKNSYAVWRDKVKAKDLAKCEKMRDEAAYLVEQCADIEKMWGKP